MKYTSYHSIGTQNFTLFIRLWEIIDMYLYIVISQSKLLFLNLNYFVVI